MHEDFKRVNRFTFTGYAGAKVMFAAFEQCGRDLTRACVIEKLGSMQNYDTGMLSAPVSFSSDQHFSDQKLLLLKANPETGNFSAVK